MGLTHVVLTGLILLEPTKDDKNNVTGLTAYVLKTEGLKTSWEQPFHPVTNSNMKGLGHHARWVGRDKAYDLSGDYELIAPGSGFAIDATEIFDLGATYRDAVYVGAADAMKPGSDTKPFTIKESCKAPRPIAQCRSASGTEILAARINITGAWRVQAVEVDEQWDARFAAQNRSLYGLVHFAPGKPPLATDTALRFRSSVLLSSLGSPAEFKSPGGKKEDLPQPSRNECFKQAGDPTPCEILSISNHLHVNEPPPGRFDERFHWHTDALYELLTSAPPERLMTFTVLEDTDLARGLFPPGFGTRAGKPCPPVTGFYLR